MPRQLIIWILSLIMMVMGAGVVFGQSFPNKLIRIITSTPGGSGDFAARIFAQALSGSLGQPVIVDNRGGASGAIAAQALRNAPPDGYTLLVHGDTIWLSPLTQNQPYDPVRDFSPITWATISPNILVVHSSLPVKSVKELIALAKARPGELNYAGANPGSVPHLSGELFKAMAGVNIVAISYKGSGPALNDLISGQVQLMFANAAATPHVKSGRLKAFAVTSTQPSAVFPGLPTVAASGLPGYEASSSNAIFAPAKTSETIINLLNQEMMQVLNRAEVKEKLLNDGQEVVGSSPGELATKVKSDMVKWGKIIEDVGIRAK